MPRTVAFCTLGCKVNQYDSQAMLERFERAGYEAAPFSASADVYVINTCTVTGTGDKKSRQMIHRATRRNPDAAIVVCGCLAQRAAESLLLPGVRLVLGTQRRMEIVTLLEQALSRDEALVAIEPFTEQRFEMLSVSASEGRTRATVKVQEGCDNRCAYCIIPSVRGPVRSRPLDDVWEEAERLADAGFLEIVVTGIHLTSYGKDLHNATLLDALRLIHQADGIQRIRIGSLEPTVVTEKFAHTLSEMPKICPQFMLALQSGSDSVLSRMGRRYTTQQYAQAAETIRKAFPDAALTTDIMTGFPGETDAEHAQSLFFVEQIGFARIHVFPYSEREGTRAVSMPGKVPKALREERAREIIALGERLEAAYITKWVGRQCEVLFEEACPEGAVGYTPEYIRVAANGTPGSIQTVCIEKALSGHAVGKVV